MTVQAGFKSRDGLGPFSVQNCFISILAELFLSSFLSSFAFLNLSIVVQQCSMEKENFEKRPTKIKTSTKFILSLYMGTRNSG